MRTIIWILALVLMGCQTKETPTMEVTDADFGEMQYNGIDAWDSRVHVTFPNNRNGYLAVHVWASPDGPSERQRRRFKELKERFPALWPELLCQVASVHEQLEMPDEVAAVVSERIAVHLGGEAEEDIQLVIELDLPDEGFRGYFIDLDEWEVGDVVVAD